MTAGSRRSTAPRDSVNPSGRPTDGMTTTRAESFSDGVVAIAITLLVLQPGTGEGGGTLAHRLSHQSPLFLSYFISFMNIGTVWLNHRHEVVSRLSHLDRTFLILNLLLLMVVSLLPFPTRVVGQELAGGTHADQRTAALLYAGTFFAASIAFLVLWRWAAKGWRLIKPDVPEQLNRVRTLRFALAIPVFAIPCGLALLNPVAALALDGAIMASFLLSDATTDTLMMRMAGVSVEPRAQERSGGTVRGSGLMCDGASSRRQPAGSIVPDNLGTHPSDRRARCQRRTAPNCETRSRRCRTRAKEATLSALRPLSNVLC